MTTLLPPDEEAWLAQFFSGRNLLTWDSIQTGSAPMGGPVTCNLGSISWRGLTPISRSFCHSWKIPITSSGSA